ncbi:hypothetical protein V8C42DRAFT_327835 [Trichoderma barbatum]
MSTFHPFLRLPIELRLRIWGLTAFPRIVRANQHRGRRGITVGELEVQCMTTSTPCPAVTQVCHESRQHAPYQRAYTNGYEPRYIWINFETDMICVSDAADMYKLEHHEQDIQRLRFSIDNEWTFDWFFYWGHKGIDKFTNLKELHVSVDRKTTAFGVVTMGDTVENCWGRYSDIVKFIDAGSGFMMTSDQIWATRDWHIYYAFDGYGKAELDTFEEDMEWMANDSSFFTLLEIQAMI